MANWEKYKLGDLIEFIIDNRGKTPPLVDNGYEIIETNAINGKNKYPDYSKISKFVDEDTFKTWFRKGHPQINDILISTVGDIGKVSIMNKNRGCIAQNLIAIRCKKELLNPEFLYYFLILNKTQDRLKNLNIGSVQPSLKVPHLLNIDIYIPNIIEQIKLVDILSKLDEKIVLNQETNQTLEAIAQAIFKSWFVDFDPVRAKAQAILDGKTSDEANLSAMAVISGKAIEDLSQTEYQELWEIADAFPSELVENAEFGEVLPKGWEVRKVGEIANFIKGKKPKQTSNFQENEMLPHILVASLSGKYGEFAPIETAVICQNKETLILMDGSGSGKVSIGHNGVVGSTLAKLNLNNEKYWAIIYLLLKSKELDIQQHTTGTSIPHTDKTRVLNYDLIIPCDVILNWFNGYFENTLYLILTNRNKSLFLEKARDELLPKLLSGEIEL